MEFFSPGRNDDWTLYELAEGNVFRVDPFPGREAAVEQ